MNITDNSNISISLRHQPGSAKLISGSSKKLVTQYHFLITHQLTSFHTRYLLPASMLNHFMVHIYWLQSQTLTRGWGMEETWSPKSPISPIPKSPLFSFVWSRLNNSSETFGDQASPDHLGDLTGNAPPMLAPSDFWLIGTIQITVSIYLSNVIDTLTSPTVTWWMQQEQQSDKHPQDGWNRQSSWLRGQNSSICVKMSSDQAFSTTKMTWLSISTILSIPLRLSYASATFIITAKLFSTFLIIIIWTCDSHQSM